MAEYPLLPEKRLLRSPGGLLRIVHDCRLLFPLVSLHRMRSACAKGIFSCGEAETMALADYLVEEVSRRRREGVSDTEEWVDVVQCRIVSLSTFCSGSMLIMSCIFRSSGLRCFNTALCGCL